MKNPNLKYIYKNEPRKILILNFNSGTVTILVSNFTLTLDYDPKNLVTV